MSAQRCDRSRRVQSSNHGRVHRLPAGRRNPASPHNDKDFAGAMDPRELAARGRRPGPAQDFLDSVAVRPGRSLQPVDAESAARIPSRPSPPPCDARSAIASTNPTSVARYGLPRMSSDTRSSASSASGRVTSEACNSCPSSTSGSNPLVAHPESSKMSGQVSSVFRFIAPTVATRSRLELRPRVAPANLPETARNTHVLGTSVATAIVNYSA